MFISPENSSDLTQYDVVVCCQNLSPHNQSFDPMTHACNKSGMAIYAGLDNLKAHLDNTNSVLHISMFIGLVRLTAYVQHLIKYGKI